MEAPMRVLLAAPDAAPFVPLIQALSEDGLDAWALGDLVGLMDPVDPSRIPGGPPALFLMAGAPAAVLQAAVEGVRKCPQTRRCLILVYQPECGLNERGRIMAAGADDCQTRVLPEAILVARVRALLRRAPAEGSDAAHAPVADATSFKAGRLTLDLVRRRAATPSGDLEPTRLQFDALHALARAGEGGLATGDLLAELARKGHATDARAAGAALDALSAELAGHGLEVERTPGSVRLVEAGSERRLASLARRFLDAFAVVANGARLYGAEHGPSLQYARAAHEALLAFTGETKAGELRVARVAKDVLVNGVRPAGGVLPAPVGELMRAAAAETLVVQAWAAPEDLARFASEVWKCQKAGAPLPEGGAVAGLRAGAYDLAAARQLMRLFVARLPGEPRGCAELFGDDGELVHRTRAKTAVFRGPVEAESFLARLPRPLTVELLAEREDGEEHVAEAAVSAGGLPAVVEEYRLVERGGRIARLEMRSRLRI